MWVGLGPAGLGTVIRFNSAPVVSHYHPPAPRTRRVTTTSRPIPTKGEDGGEHNDEFRTAGGR